MLRRPPFVPFDEATLPNRAPSIDRRGPTEVFDLNKWYRAIHQVTGAMALKFTRATADDVRRWAETLRAVADEMQKGRSGNENRTHP
jgi:hypothetical protein